MPCWTHTLIVNLPSNNGDRVIYSSKSVRPYGRAFSHSVSSVALGPRKSAMSAAAALGLAHPVHLMHTPRLLQFYHKQDSPAPIRTGRLGVIIWLLSKDPDSRHIPTGSYAKARILLLISDVAGNSWPTIRPLDGIKIISKSTDRYRRSAIRTLTAFVR